MADGQKSKGMGFFTMVGLVMGGLKLREYLRDYRRVPDDEEGRVALNTTRLEGDTEENEGLLNTEIPAPNRHRYARKKSCCVCCGIDFTVFWKAVGIVICGLVIYNVFLVIKWAVTPSPTGLESLPAYSTSLGCLDAPHIYNGSAVSYSVPVSKGAHHVFDIRGSAVGTVVLKKGSADDTNVRYEFTVRTTDANLLNQVAVQFMEERDSVRLLTPVPDINSKDCSRFDITMYVPPTLQQLAMASHTTTHVLFDTDEADINLDKFTATLFEPDTNNQIISHLGFHAKTMSLEIFRGWIVGEVSVVESTSLKTQQGDGVINVHATVLPYRSNGEEVPTALFRTVSGAGRTDVHFSSDKGFPHRKIEAHHLASRNGDMYLTYKEAEFNGMVQLKAKSYTATRLQSSQAIDEKDWTHSAGDAKGGDELYVNTRGWAGLYF